MNEKIEISESTLVQSELPMENLDEFVIIQNRPQVLDTRRHIMKNNQIQLIGNKESLNNIYYVNIFIRIGSKLFPTKVDLQDYNDFLRFKIWTGRIYSGLIYAGSSSTISKYKRDGILMHRYIMEKHGFDLTGKLIDHINGNPLDNRFKNLRVGDYIINAVNRRPYANINKESKYKGVCKEKSKKKWNGKWRAVVTYNKQTYYLGQYDTEKEAAIAYNNKITELLGHADVYLNKV